MKLDDLKSKSDFFSLEDASLIASSLCNIFKVFDGEGVGERLKRP